MQASEVGAEDDDMAEGAAGVTTHDVMLLFDTVDGRTVSPPAQQPIQVTSALATTVVRARLIAGTSAPPLAFGTLLAAMLSGPDPWLLRHLRQQGADLDAIARELPYTSIAPQAGIPPVPSGGFLATVSARGALDEARRIADAAAGPAAGVPLDLRHLLAAYPMMPAWHLDDFERFRIDRLRWARAWAVEAARRHPAERAYWAAFADRAAPVPLTSFSADTYTEQDLLGIDRAVDALGLLVASTRTVTPLAIGVFGPWGSGKTFYMRHLQRRIVGLRAIEAERVARWQQLRAQRKATPADAPLYHAGIVQVEFNAWHYNEGNLVASLVEHLFRNLRVLPGDTDDELAARRTTLLAQLQGLKDELGTIGQAIGDAEHRVADAQQAQAQAREAAEQARQGVQAQAEAVAEQSRALQAERRELDRRSRELQAASTQVAAVDLAAVALQPLEPLLGEIRSTLAQAREQAFDWAGFARRLVSRPGLYAVLLIVVVPFMPAVRDWLGLQWAALVAAVAAIGAAMRPFLEVLRAQRAAVEAKLAQLEAQREKREAEIRRDVEARTQSVQQAQARVADQTRQLDLAREALAVREQALQAAAAALADRAREHDERLAARTAAEAAVRDAEATLKRLSSALLLEEFIKDRASTDEYRRQLGFLALVRRDIERLSQLIEDSNRRWLDPSRQDPAPPINRIVLYVDDLDRCKESTVLAVLEAVHLLLAFPLFVCAVAADPRWIEHCLRSLRPELFAAGDGPEPADERATVADYLEKIFQIPIWMAPIAPADRARLVQSLLGTTATPPPRVGEAGEAVGGEGAGAAAGAGAGAGQGAAASTAGRAGAQVARGAGAFLELADRKREAPDPLRITPEESACIAELAPLLSERPRALKRLVNVYRLLKASLPDVEHDGWVDATPSSPHRVCLMQLALFTSHPRLAPGLVEAMSVPQAQVAGAAPTHSVQAWLEALPASERDRLRPTINRLPGAGSVELQAFQRWLPHTSRYLFERGRRAGA